MGSQIVGIAPHTIVSYDDLEALPARLQPLLQAAYSVNEYCVELVPLPPDCEPAWRIGAWGIPSKAASPREQWETHTGPVIFGPGPNLVDSGAWLVPGRHCLVATTSVKWSYAVHHPEIFPVIANYFRSLTRVVGGMEFILFRDQGCKEWDWVFDGLNFEEIRGKLREIGASAVSEFAGLLNHGGGRWGTNFYHGHV